jgi:hypothetical protein
MQHVNQREKVSSSSWFSSLIFFSALAGDKARLDLVLGHGYGSTGCLWHTPFAPDFHIGQV